MDASFPHSFSLSCVQLITERFAIEMNELAEVERKLDEAEEEEMWLLTLQQQSRHIHVSHWPGTGTGCFCGVHMGWKSCLPGFLSLGARGHNLVSPG